jgi:GNAT superfamily N-acetyltransferase
MPTRNASGPERVRIERLHARHDRSGFRSGHASLDQYLKVYASQHQRSGTSQTHVALLDDFVVGFISLSAGSVAFDELPRTLATRSPRHPLPTVHIGRMAVDQRHQGKGVGAVLLTHARVLASGVANQVGVRALTATAIDDWALAFYLHHGFTRLEAGSRSVLLALRPS